jgi:hypothetical protein
MARPAKYFSLSPAHNREGLQAAVRYHPLKLGRVVWTAVDPVQGQVLEQQVNLLLVKEAIERVPLPDRESGFYSRYFIVPKKDGGLHQF